MIRIGGQSQSKILEGMNLRSVSKGEVKTGSEKFELGSKYGMTGSQGEVITSKLKVAHNLRPDWASLKVFLSREYSRIYSQFSRIDAEGFEKAGSKEPFDLWKNGTGEDISKLADSLGTVFNILQKANNDVFNVCLNDRQILLNHWLQEMHEDLNDDIFDSIKEFEECKGSIATIHDEIDRRVLQTAEVIGVTTSGLAKRISVLRHIHAKVVICEEAGEVSEAHLLSALIPSVQSLIQIGDHQQLRPQIANFNLSLESPQGELYKLDRSQFERLSVAENGRPAFPISQLNVQRRMRPEISALIRNTVYPRLVDHETIKHLPDVVGMRKNLFWLHHNNLEDSKRPDANQKSKSNLWEVFMTHALVRHIVRQGIYSSKEIAVLTPYAGQLRELRAIMQQDFEIVLSERDENVLLKDGFTLEDSNPPRPNRPILKKRTLTELLRIATIDNFQGEEAKIIIVSLVRSNIEKKVGFLQTNNRINVLLSRAQHGMYLIGNSETYSNIPMWSDVLGILRADDSIGEYLSLCCPRHTDTEIRVYQPDHFATFSPEGGCLLPCDRSRYMRSSMPC